MNSCRQDPPILGLGLDDAYAVERMRTLALHPQYAGDNYEWRLNDSLVATTRDYVFCQAVPATYRLSFRIVDELTPVFHEMTIRVVEEEIAYSPFISKVYDYCPAPGQFVNVLPAYEEGDTYAAMLRKAEDAISGENSGLITLGGWGGYVTFGFDHAVMNRQGERDFQIKGNAIKPTSVSGSSEPGIVMVSIDRNGNRLPDDEWYELQGSEHLKQETQHDYQITYFQGNEVTWQDNRDKQGSIPNNQYHTQPYYPQWLTDSQLTFQGTCLPPNATLEGNMYVYTVLDYGYADNKPNSDTDGTSFDISWATDTAGQPVHLDCIDFVRVYTGVNQVCGWTGETSTEITGATDLNLTTDN